jgi:hypothetical protein
VLTYGNNRAFQYANPATFTSPAITGVETAISASYNGDPLGIDDPSTSAPLITEVTARTLADLQPLLNSLRAGLSRTTAVAVNIDPTTESAAISAVNSLTGAGTVVLNLSPGTYTSATLSPAGGITLIINGVKTNTIIDPDTPALTVTSGNVVVEGVTFTETGDAPTILVSGGDLAERDSNVQGSTTYSDPAIAVSGGSTVDLGTAASPGGNTVTVTGIAPPVQSTGTNVVLTQGSTFQANGIPVYPAAVTTLASSANVSVWNQPVTFSAGVAAPISGTPAPTGTVTFTDTTTGQTLGTVTLSSGGASVTVAGLSVGTHNVTALYSGDSNYISNSAVVTQTVNQGPTTATITTSAGTSIPAQAVTFTVSVSSTAPGSGVPTGSVDIRDTISGIDLGPVALVNGSATLTTSALPLSTYNFQAIYSGDPNFLTSSASVAQTVTQSIYVLNATAAGAVNVSGYAGINIPGSLIVDSSSKTALTESGNAKITAGSVQVVGGVSKSGNATLSPAAATGVPVVANPLANLTGPSTSGLASYGAVSYSKGSYTLCPGIYKSISASGNASLTLNPGVYLIEGGGFTVTGNASISGTGVTIYNTSSNYPSSTGSYGGIALSGNGTFSLTAPASGCYAGVVIFQPSANTRAISLSGNAGQGLSGTVYAPAALLFLSGNATVNGALVVNELSLSGNAASTQAADSGDVSGGDAAGQLLAGNLEVYVNDPNNLFTTDELARIQDAVNAADAVVEPYGVSVSETTDPTLANVTIDTGSTSAVGGQADGILGCWNPAASEITLVQGWNWYAGSDPTQVGANQYDFQTTLTHELGHALGLGESDDPTSAMSGTLAPGTVIRTLTTADLNIPYDEAGADPQRAAPVASAVASVNPSVARDVALGEPVVVGVPATMPPLAVSVHDVTSLTPEAINLAEADGPVPTRRLGADLTVSTAGVAPAALPVTPAAAGGSPQMVQAAVVTLGKPLPAAGVGNAGIVPGAGATDPAAVETAAAGARAAAVDAYFRALPQEGGFRLRSEAGGTARVAAFLRDLAGAPGSKDGRDTGALAGPVVGDLTAAGSVLFGLLGAAWGSQAEEREARRRRCRLPG